MRQSYDVVALCRINMKIKITLPQSIYDFTSEKTIYDQEKPLMCGFQVFKPEYLKPL